MYLVAARYNRRAIVKTRAAVNGRARGYTLYTKSSSSRGRPINRRNSYIHASVEYTGNLELSNSSLLSFSYLCAREYTGFVSYQPTTFFAALNLLRARSATIHITDLNCARVQNWTDVKRCARAPVRRYRSSAHTYSNRARSRNRQSSSFHARSGKLQI